MTSLQTARALLLAYALLLLPLARVESAGPENAGEALLRRVGERYASAQTLSAKFRQEIPLQNVGIVRKASGTVYFGRPLKMRWDYKGPGGKIPLLLLFGKGEITTLFRVDAADPRKGGEETVLRLSPRGDGRPRSGGSISSSARGTRSSAKFTSSTGWAGRTTFTLPT